MVADLGALRESPYAQVVGLALLAVLLSAVLVVVPTQAPYLPGWILGVALFIACGAMLAAFLRLTTHRFPSRPWAILLAAAAYLLLGFLYGNLRYAITEERAFLIGMAPFIWPWLLVWDAGCLLGIWECVTLGN